MLLSDPKIGSHKISGSLLWQIGLLIMEEDYESSFCSKFFELNIVDVLMKKKAQMTP